MNTLQTTLQDRMKELGYEAIPEFYHAEKIVFEKEGKKYLHAFNYLGQEYALEKYLELNDNCIEFNKEFYYERHEGLTDAQKQWLESHDFSPVIDHVFTNKQLEIDFYPQLKSYPIKDKDNNHYLLASVQ